MPQANVTVTPTSATFPEIDPSEEYNCHFINNTLNYSFTLPLVDGKYCDASAASIPSFGFKQIGDYPDNYYKSSCCACIKINIDITIQSYNYISCQ